MLLQITDLIWNFGFYVKIRFLCVSKNWISDETIQFSILILISIKFHTYLYFGNNTFWYKNKKNRTIHQFVLFEVKRSDIKACHRNHGIAELSCILKTLLTYHLGLKYDHILYKVTCLLSNYIYCLCMSFFYEALKNVKNLKMR